MKKLILLSLLAVISCFAQDEGPSLTPVAPVVPTSAVGTIVVVQNGTTTTYTITLSAAALKAMAQFIADTTKSAIVNGSQVNTPKYQDVGDLTLKHLAASLVGPLVEKYPDSSSSVVAAQQAAKAAQDAASSAVVTAASPTITIH